MSSYEPYQRSSTPVIKEAIHLWGLKTPLSKIPTKRLLRLYDRYKAVIQELSKSEHPYDDVMLTELTDTMNLFQDIIDQRLLREQYGRLDRLR